MTGMEPVINELMQIPGVGKSIARDLLNIGVRSVKDLKNRDPHELYDLSNKFAGTVQDRCLLYVFRCAVYYASTEPANQDHEKLKWWNWKEPEKKSKSSGNRNAFPKNSQ